MLFRRAFALSAALVAVTTVRAADWPQWLGPQRDGVWREDGVLDKFPAGGPPVKWRAPVGAGYSGPAVADGRVYLTDYAIKGSMPTRGFSGRAKLEGEERVHCLDATTGK